MTFPVSPPLLTWLEWCPPEIHWVHFSPHNRLALQYTLGAGWVIWLLVVRSNWWPKHAQTKLKQDLPARSAGEATWQAGMHWHPWHAWASLACMGIAGMHGHCWHALAHMCTQARMGASLTWQHASFQRQELHRLNQKHGQACWKHPTPCLLRQASPELESERARKRAERFGINHPDIEAEKSRKRKERFGVEDPEAKMQVSWRAGWWCMMHVVQWMRMQVHTQFPLAVDLVWCLPVFLDRPEGAWGPCQFSCHGDPEWTHPGSQ